MKQTHAYKINLTRIDGNGDFSCPGCGTKISPDDETEEIYSIMGSKANIHGLEEIEIQCNRCSSHIHLTGFSILQEAYDNNQETQKAGKSETPLFYVAHV